MACMVLFNCEKTPQVYGTWLGSLQKFSNMSHKIILVLLHSTDTCLTCHFQVHT